jgi:hypothetical protein
MAMEIIYIGTSTLTKLSILFFYRRITSSVLSRPLLITIWASIVFGKAPFLLPLLHDANSVDVKLLFMALPASSPSSSPARPSKHTGIASRPRGCALTNTNASTRWRIWWLSLLSAPHKTFWHACCPCLWYGGCDYP